jgi:uncharacterized ion transporter superfamily protein YfcC
MTSVQELLRPAPVSEPTGHTRRSLMPHPIVMMILIIAAALVLSRVIPSGQFTGARQGAGDGG